MKIVIDIPDEDIPKNQKIIDIRLHFIDGHIVDADGYGFIELPKGHGDLIDRKKLQNNIDDKDIISPKDISKIQTLRKWINNQNPIIEADKAESEE